MVQFLRRLHFRYWPLAVKLVVILMMAIVATAVSITLLSVRREQESFQNELEQQADLLLDALTASGTDPLYFLDLDTLSDIMESLGEDQLILVSGRFYDRNGRVVADAFDEDRALMGEPDLLGLTLLQSEDTIYQWSPDKLVAGRAIVIGHQPVGAISVGLPTAQLQTKVDTVRKEGFGVALATTIIGGLFAILFGRTVTGPILRLVAEADRIAAGDLAHPISVQRNDELTALGSAMEHMRAKMQQMTATLEQEVAERTRALQDSESRFRLLISSISDYIYVVNRDADGRWTTGYLSPNITLVTGFPHTKFLKEHRFWRSHIHPEDDAIVTRQSNDFSQGHNSVAEYRFIH
ncbi:MAG: HAMP domain-containing protein, partial [Anaerolineae bacterium]